MFVWFISENTIIIIMFWSFTKITFLILTANSNNIFVFLTLKILHETAVSVIKLIIFKLALKKQFFINEHVNLCWWNYIHNQIYYCFIKFDDFFKLLCMQNFNFLFEIFILFYKLLYYFFLLDTIKNSNLHFIHYNWKFSLIDLNFYIYCC